MAHYRQLPSVYVDFMFYRGEPADGHAVEMPRRPATSTPQLESTLRESGLFSPYTLDEFQKQPGDYTLRLGLYNSGSQTAAAVGGLISGLTTNAP